MSKLEIKPHKISKPFQLLAAWLVALVLIDGFFLWAASKIESPSWISPFLVISSVIITIVFIRIIFLLQTKYRSQLQDDEYYNKWLNHITSKERPETDVIPPITESEALKEVKCGENQIVLVKDSDEENCILYFKGRINFSKEAGSANLMRIKVNDEFLRDSDLINKPPIKIIADGRLRNWFNSNDNSWQLVFSPNFKDNYFHRAYKVVNGDPYIFIFDLSRIRRINSEKFKVEIEHVGNLFGDASHNNSLIIKDISIF